MSRSVKLLLVVSVLGTPWAVAAGPGGDFAQALDEAAARGRYLDHLVLEVQALNHQGLTGVGAYRMRLYGSGVGVWMDEKQFKLTREEMRPLLELLREHKPAAWGPGAAPGNRPPMTRVTGEGVKGGPVARPAAKTVPGRPSVPASRVTLRIGEQARTLTQPVNVAPGKEFVALVKALRQVAEKALERNGTGCHSFEDGLARLGRGELAAELLQGQVVSYRVGAKNDGATGWELAWSGRTLTAKVLEKGQTKAEVRRDMTAGQMSALRDALHEARLATLPATIYSATTTHVSAGILNQRHEIQAHPFEVYKETATPQEEQRLARLVERLRALYQGVVPQGAP